MPRQSSEHFQCLFSHKEGPVQVELWGPKIGWQFGVVDLFRWEPSPKHPGKFREAPVKRGDIKNLKKCVDALAKWQKTIANNRLKPFKRPKNL